MTAAALDPLQLLVVSLRYPPYVAGGYELRTRDVVEGLRARGHRISVLCGRGQRLEDQADVLPWLEPGLDTDAASFEHSFAAGNAERFRLHFFRGANLRATRRALRATGAELMYYFNLSLASLAPLIAARVEGVPALGDVSDPWPENHWVRAWRQRRASGAGGSDPATDSQRLPLLERAWATFRGDAGLGPFLVPSRFLRQSFVADGIDAEQIEVNPTGLDPSFTSPVVQQRPLPRRGPNEPLRVLCAGSLWEGKGAHVALDAVERCLLRGQAIGLVVAGAAPGGPESTAYRDRLIGMASRPPLKGQVRFTGGLTRAALADELAAAHVFAFPSQWGEPYARAPLEAMAYGLCVVSADSGANAEQLAAGVEGLLVPPGDGQALALAFERLGRDEMLRQRLADAGRKHVFRECGFDHYLDRIEGHLRRYSNRNQGGAA